MYRIIGVDQKEYGPISQGQIEQWLKEGRITGQTPAKVEGGGQWQPVNMMPEFAQAATAAAPFVAQSPGDPISALVPYKNMQALIAYYLGIFSLFPFLGALLGITAFVLGIRGLMFASKHPEAKGKVHAWIGIVCGGLFGGFWALCVIMMIIAIASGK